MSGNRFSATEIADRLRAAFHHKHCEPTRVETDPRPLGDADWTGFAAAVERLGFNRGLLTPAGYANHDGARLLALYRAGVMR